MNIQELLFYKTSVRQYAKNGSNTNVNVKECLCTYCIRFDEEIHCMFSCDINI